MSNVQTPTNFLFNYYVIYLYKIVINTFNISSIYFNTFFIAFSSFYYNFKNADSTKFVNIICTVKFAIWPFVFSIQYS